MTRIILTALVVATGFVAQGAPTEAGVLDRIEDRLDRRESYLDRQVDNGRRDRIEDRIDAVESRLDRRGIEHTPRIDRHERRKIRRWTYEAGTND